MPAPVTVAAEEAAAAATRSLGSARAVLTHTK